MKSISMFFLGLLAGLWTPKQRSKEKRLREQDRITRRAFLGLE